jgi:Heparinase II/III-like protein/Heparinase II/III N-terminus
MIGPEKVSRAWGLVRNHSPSWLAARLVLEAQKRTGWEERIYPPRAWATDEWQRWVADRWRDAEPSAVLAAWREGTGGDGAAWGRRRRGPVFHVAHAAVLGTAGRASLLAAGEEILGGRFTMFARHTVSAGFPPAWQANPLMGGAVPAGAPHWSRLSMRDAATYGDLKLVWELSRGAWAFTLARAYAASGDERFAEGFWRLWMSWIEANPPHETVHWKCGQECSLRLIAVTFAVEVLAGAAATTPERFVTHLGAVGALADRIHQGGRYAQLQDNNHSMSEGAGAYTAGVAYPLLRDAGIWRESGWRRLGEEALRLVRPDGTFRQKSHNYHRLMLHLYLWSASLAAEVGDRFAGVVRARLEAAVRYLEAVVDAESGEAPNFVANDGALILPLGEAAYTDFRPTLRAGRRLAARLAGAHEGSAPVVAGDDLDEMSLWLFGAVAAPAAVVPRTEAPPRAFVDGGIYTLHQPRSWVFAHAEHFRDRPGQADQLHVDLWWRGINVARDAGTYMYYGPPGLNDWFRGSSCHNTVTVDGRDQMEPGPRFLWASRAQARARIDHDASAVPGSLWMTHDGYQRLSPPVSHERRVTALGDDVWLVTDELRGARSRHYRLHWLLPDFPARPDGDGVWVLETPAGPYFVQVVVVGRPNTVAFLRRAVADEAAPWGWESRHYAERTPAQSLIVEVTGTEEKLVTVFSPRRPAGEPPGDPIADVARETTTT